MAREHVNNVVAAGPMTKFQVFQTDKYGTKVQFLVAGSDVPIRVSAKIKYDWMIKQAQEAKSVVFTNGFMNGWEKEGKYNFNLGARSGGLYFLGGMITPYIGAHIEGTVMNVSGPWVTVHSNYTVPNQSGQQAQSRYRIVVIRFPYDQDPKALGNLIYAMGVPNPKLNDKWYLHLEAVKGWVLWGKK